MKLKRFLLLLPIVLCLFSLSGFAQSTATDNFRRYESPELNGLTDGTFDLGAIFVDSELDRRFCITGISVLILDADNLLTSATFTVGTNGSNYNNILTTSTIGNTVSLGPTSFRRLAENTAVKVRITVAATGVPLTTPALNFKVILTGYDELN